MEKYEYGRTSCICRYDFQRTTRRLTGVPIILPANKPTRIMRYPPKVPIVIIAVC